MTKSYALPEIRTSRHGKKLSTGHEQQESLAEIRAFSTNLEKESDQFIFEKSPKPSEEQLIKNPDGFVTLEFEPKKQQ